METSGLGLGFLAGVIVTAAVVLVILHAVERERRRDDSTRMLEDLDAIEADRARREFEPEP